MPCDVEEELRQLGQLGVSEPHAPATVRRRLANWSTLARWRGLEGAFSSPAVKSAILPSALLTGPRSRKSANEIIGDILGKLLAICSSGNLTALRDRTILMLAFASGGRRRSELANHSCLCATPKHGISPMLWPNALASQSTSSSSVRWSGTTKNCASSRRSHPCPSGYEACTC